MLKGPEVTIQLPTDLDHPDFLAAQDALVRFKHQLLSETTRAWDFFVISVKPNGSVTLMFTGAPQER